MMFEVDILRDKYRQMKVEAIGVKPSGSPSVDRQAEAIFQRTFEMVLNDVEEACVGVLIAEVETTDGPVGFGVQIVAG